MEFLDRYKNRTKQSIPDPADAPFIENALNKITIQKVESGEPLGEELEAVLIFKDKDGPDSGILYTYKDDGLDVGDTIVKKGSIEETDSYFILVEEVKRVDGSRVIRVFNTLEANVWLSLEADTKEYPGYIVSNLKKQIDTDEKNTIITEGKHATVVIPKSYGFNINDILSIKNIISKEESYSDWRIDGKDDVSSPYIVYGFLTQTFKTGKDTPTPFTLTDSSPQVQNEPGSRKVLDSLNGYIKSDRLISILNRTELTVEIRLPTEQCDVNLDLKDANGEIYKKIIKVGE